MNSLAGDALADALFTPVQQRVLGLLFGQPERRYQSAELTRLAATGLVSATSVGNQKFYQANPASPVFGELCGMIQKTVGLAGPLQAALAPLANRITAAFVYGSIAKGVDRAALAGSSASHHRFASNRACWTRPGGSMP